MCTDAYYWILTTRTLSPPDIKRGPPLQGPSFYICWRDEVDSNPLVRQIAPAIWTAAGAPEGGQNAGCNRVLSLRGPVYPSQFRPDNVYRSPCLLYPKDLVFETNAARSILLKSRPGQDLLDSADLAALLLGVPERELAQVDFRRAKQQPILAVNCRDDFVDVFV